MNSENCWPRHQNMRQRYDWARKIWDENTPGSNDTYHQAGKPQLAIRTRRRKIVQGVLVHDGS